MTTAKKLSTKKNLVLNAIKTLTTILFPLISLPYATRVLGKGGLGDVTYAESIVSYFALFAALGIVAYGTRELAKKRQDAQQANQLPMQRWQYLFSCHPSTLMRRCFGCKAVLSCAMPWGQSGTLPPQKITCILPSAH